MGKFWFLFCFLTQSLIIALAAAADNSYHLCYSSANYTADSVYLSSRNSQLFALADSVKDQGGYYRGNTITIPPAPVPDCLGVCRKDLISSDVCHSCISNSASDITRNCPDQSEVVSWGADAGCLVHCSPPTKLENTYDVQHSAYECNATSVPVDYLGHFSRALTNLTAQLAVKAADAGTSSSFSVGFSAPLYFAAEQVKFSDVFTVYGVGFCVPDLSVSDCTSCLKATANQSSVQCNGEQGGKVFTPSCVLRYELYPFYTLTAASVAAAPPPLSPSSDVKKKVGKVSRTSVSTIVFPVVAVVTLIIFMAGFRIFLKRRKQHWDYKDDTLGAESIESCLEFSFNAIRAATNGFSESNKLGQGGFGAVYKGTLPNGMVVAVKRLTHCVAQGEAEFKNEVQLVARLHHRNLVRLLGFCLGGKERILVYELALNGSLDSILFDANRRENLTWKIRYNIIEGIARGLLYLHEESQLRIIHRDLKASNVLLDGAMNPKIADFGTARLFVEDYGSASRIVGTYGYMPPEYAKFGKISTKVDVFSFGVLLLEIVTGRKNNEAKNPKQIEHLLSKTWKCWTSGQVVELIDPILLRESSQIHDMTRCIHIGLLCVQEIVGSRPQMNEVILLLEACSQSLPAPSEPAYLMEIVSDELVYRGFMNQTHQISKEACVRCPLLAFLQLMKFLSPIHILILDEL